MSIIGVGTVVYRPFPGYTAPGLPSGFWLGVGEVEGDLSGGDRILNFNLKTAGEGLATRVFTLEQLTITSLETTARNVEMQTGNMDFINGLPADAIWVATGILAVGRTQAALDQQTLKLPAFLGNPRSTALAAFLSISIANANLIALLATAQGYTWDGRAILEPGGPQRPLNGIYGP